LQYGDSVINKDTIQHNSVIEMVPENTTVGPSIKYVTLEGGEGVREGVTVCDRGRG